MLRDLNHVKIQITDDEFLSSIPHHQIGNYLWSNGWDLRESIEDRQETRATIWMKDGVDGALWLPHVKSIPDYSLHISSLLDLLAQVSSSSPLAIAHEIIHGTPKDDLVKVQKEIQSGQVSVQTATWLVSEVKRLRRELDDEVMLHFRTMGELQLAKAQSEKNKSDQ